MTYNKMIKLIIEENYGKIVLVNYALSYITNFTNFSGLFDISLVYIKLSI